MDFGEALRAVKSGKRIARAGWNGNGQFIYYCPPASYPANRGAMTEYFGEGAMVAYRDYLAIMTTDGTVATWAPSCSDALAEDWDIL